MSAVLNDRDAILQAASVRIVNPKSAWINLQASAPGFHVNAAGQADVSVVTVTADLIGLDDAVTFSAVGATLSNAAARKVDVTYGGQTAIVTATVVSNGDEFKRSLIIPVLRDGASGTGTPGARGAGHYYATGSAWTDTLANITVPTTKVVGDVVTISSGSFFAEKRWTGSAWVDNGVRIPGSLLIEESVKSAAVDTRGLDIKDATGNIIFRANATLAEQAQINPNLVESFRSWVRFGNSYILYEPATSINGESMVLPPNTYAQSRLLTLEPNVDYILSFRALSYNANTALTVDLYPDNLPEFSTGALPAAPKHFQFNMRSSAAEMGAATLRVLGSANGQIQISDIKLERSPKATAWCDNVITPTNASTFILAAAIKLAMIDKASIGQLSALVAYLGNVELGPLGALRQRALNFGDEGIFFGANANGDPVLSMVKGDRKILFDLSSPNPLQIINPDIQQAQLGMSGVPASINGGSSLPNYTTWRVYGSFTVTPLNVQGTATVTAFQNPGEGEIKVDQTGNTITVSGRGTGGANGTAGRTNRAVIIIAVSDSKTNGTAYARVSATGSHGTIQ